MSKEQVSKDNEIETQIRPYKWSAWDFELFSRDREGKTEFAFITTEHKWVTLAIEGGEEPFKYNLVPVEQHKLLAPLFEGITTSTDMYFVIDGVCGVDEADGGYIDMEFSEQHLKTEYATLQKLNKNHELGETDILFEMGFKEYEDKMNISDDYTRTVIKFNQRKLGE